MLGLFSYLRLNLAFILRYSSLEKASGTQQPNAYTNLLPQLCNKSACQELKCGMCGWMISNNQYMRLSSFPLGMTSIKAHWHIHLSVITSFPSLSLYCVLFFLPGNTGIFSPVMHALGCSAGDELQESPLIAARGDAALTASLCDGL